MPNPWAQQTTMRSSTSEAVPDDASSSGVVDRNLRDGDFVPDDEMSTDELAAELIQFRNDDLIKAAFLSWLSAVPALKTVCQEKVQTRMRLLDGSERHRCFFQWKVIWFNRRAAERAERDARHAAEVVEPPVPDEASSSSDSVGWLPHAMTPGRELGAGARP